MEGRMVIPFWQRWWINKHVNVMIAFLAINLSM